MLRTASRFLPIFLRQNTRLSVFFLGYLPLNLLDIDSSQVVLVGNRSVFQCWQRAFNDRLSGKGRLCHLPYKLCKGLYRVGSQSVCNDRVLRKGVLLCPQQEVRSYAPQVQTGEHLQIVLHGFQNSSSSVFSVADEEFLHVCCRDLFFVYTTKTRFRVRDTSVYDCTAEIDLACWLPTRIRECALLWNWCGA